MTGTLAECKNLQLMTSFLTHFSKQTIQGDAMDNFYSEIIIKNSSFLDTNKNWSLLEGGREGLRYKSPVINTGLKLVVNDPY